MRPVLADGFCKAGGAGKGFHDAGFDVVGIDIEPQPNYPFEFIQADWFEFMEKHWREFDAFHTSPPCQFGSVLTPMAYRGNHPNLIPQTRAALKATGRPYVIENVENVRRHLINPVKLCGSMFGLGVWRHRYFEIWPDVMLMTPTCNHSNIPVLISGTRRRDNNRFEFTAQQCRDAAGLDWMTRKEMDEAIPPAFTEFIGRHMLAHLTRTAQPLPDVDKDK